jgi:hypothetical protein
VSKLLDVSSCKGAVGGRGGRGNSMKELAGNGQPWEGASG